MDPTRPAGSPHLAKAYSSDALPNPLYGMHVNAAVAGSSTQRSFPQFRSSSSPTSFYPSHLVQQPRQPQPPPKPSKLASPAPLPPSLMPGGAARTRPSPGLLGSLESSLFFQSGSAPQATSSDSSLYPKLDANAGDDQVTTRPALPPKPRTRVQSSIPLTTNGPTPEVPPKPFASPYQYTAPTCSSKILISVNEEDLVARTLEISLKESRSSINDDLDDEILRWVLKESAASTNTSDAHKTHTEWGASSPRRSEVNSSSEAPSTSSSRPFVETSTSSAHSAPSASDGSNLRHRSADAGVEEIARQERELLRTVEEVRRKQLKMDEEFARSIALLEAESASSSSVVSPASTTTHSGSFSSPSPNRSQSNKPEPSSTDRSGVSYFALPTSQLNTSGSLDFSRQPLEVNTRPHSVPINTSGRIGGSSHAGSATDPVVPPHRQLVLSVSAQNAVPSVSGNSSSTITETSTQASGIRLNSVVATQRTRGSGSVDASPSAQGRPGLTRDTMRRNSGPGARLGPPPWEGPEEDNADFSQTSPISPNEPDEGRMVTHSSPTSPSIVEEELLLGVSFGFNTPLVSQINEPMQGPIPNVITLPFGKCPPLHIQAPNWKHLLKLLTRPSDSRIEPTVEALAGNKAEMKLRTVIQFMKVHRSSGHWRTIVYLTIDVPVPSSAPNNFKYINGNVNTLPYSYTTSPLPALLRIGAGESDISKCFTVPATASNPYPTLPMTLPDFALYLHAILEDSRRAANDSSGGLRKLAKIVDTLYPADSPESLDQEFDIPDRKGVGKFFRRALGRGHKETRNQRGGNAERYEFITPFRIDEYR